MAHSANRQSKCDLYAFLCLVSVCVLGILAKMKEGAENVERKIQAKVESLKNANENDKGKGENIDSSLFGRRTRKAINSFFRIQIKWSEIFIVRFGLHKKKKEKKNRMESDIVFCYSIGERVCVCVRMNVQATCCLNWTNEWKNVDESSGTPNL